MISIYIALRFEWKFAVPVLIALMHDLLITAGVYALTGREVTTSTVAALLTILGFSLYDTIIVFDRIRENVPRMPRAAFSQIVNRSMSEVLARSLATSFCTVLPILALLLFGGDTLKDFAFALLVGTLRAPTRRSSSPRRCSRTGRSASRSTGARRAGSREQFGGIVPAYAVATAGAPVDVAPAERRAAPPSPSPRSPTQGLAAGVRRDGPRPRHRRRAGAAATAAAGASRPAAPAARPRPPTADRRRRARLGGAQADDEGGKPASRRRPRRSPRNRSHGRAR